MNKPSLTEFTKTTGVPTVSMAGDRDFNKSLLFYVQKLSRDRQSRTDVSAPWPPGKPGFPPSP